jgi:uncharacterized protein HemX
VNTEIPENNKEITSTEGSEETHTGLDQEAGATEQPEREPESGQKSGSPEPATPVAAESRRGGSFLAFLSFLFAVAAAAGVTWLWWQDRTAEGMGEERLLTEIARLESSDSEQARRLDDLAAALAARGDVDVGAQIEALQRRIESERSGLEGAEQAVAEQLALSRSLQAAAEALQGRLAAVEAAVQGLSARELNAGGAMDLAEVDFLLRLAHERLQLFRDPASADQALGIADMHLAALENPLYLGVRQDIASARQALGRVALPDYPALDAELDAIQELIPQLPFPGDPVNDSAGSEAETEQGWWAKVKSVFSSLVTVRRSTESDHERISLADKDMIHQRAWLQLEAARLALMRRDQAGFRSALERSALTLEQWFDPSDRSYQTAMGRIDHLQGVEIDVELPDITAPWSTLRLLRSGPAATAAPAVADAPEPAAEAGQPASGQAEDDGPGVPAGAETEEPAAGDGEA